MQRRRDDKNIFKIDKSETKNKEQKRNSVKQCGLCVFENNFCFD